MVSIVELKKYISNAYIIGIFISKLSYNKEPSPIILFKVNKNAKISLCLIPKK